MSWIGITSTILQGPRRLSMNDGYGKLVSRFPHLLSTMVLHLFLLLLTPFFYHPERYLHVSMIHTLLLYRTGTTQPVKPSNATGPQLIQTYPTHMSPHLTSIMRMRWLVYFPTTRTLPIPRYTTPTQLPFQASIPPTPRRWPTRALMSASLATHPSWWTWSILTQSH